MNTRPFLGAPEARGRDVDALLASTGSMPAVGAARRAGGARTWARRASAALARVLAVPPDVAAIVAAMIARRPEGRPSAAEVLAHPVFMRAAAQAGVQASVATASSDVRAAAVAAATLAMSKQPSVGCAVGPERSGVAGLSGAPKRRNNGNKFSIDSDGVNMLDRRKVPLQRHIRIPARAPAQAKIIATGVRSTFAGNSKRVSTLVRGGSLLQQQPAASPSGGGPLGSGLRRLTAS